MTLNEIQSKINALKILLAQTDYKDMKLIEAIAQGKDISDYSETIVKRQEWRDSINQYEGMIEREEYELESGI